MVAEGGKLRFLSGEMLRVGLHLLLLAANLIQAGDVAADAILIVNRFGDLGFEALLFGGIGRDLLFQAPRSDRVDGGRRR